MPPDVTASLTAPHTLQYTYKRSLGKVLSAFFTGLTSTAGKGSLAPFAVEPV